MEDRGGHIYIISCSHDDRIYVGSTFAEPARRWKQHSRILLNGSHHSPRLQALFDNHGMASLEFRAVEFVQEANFVRAREQCWINRNLHRLLNAAPSAWGNDRTGASKMPASVVAVTAERMKGNSFRRGIKHSDADKKKISEGLKKAHREGRRAPVDPIQSTKNLTRWNNDVKAGLVDYPQRKVGRNAELLAFHREAKSIKETARHFGITASVAREIIVKNNPSQLIPKRKFNSELIAQMRAMFPAKRPNEIALTFGVSKTHTRRIIKGEAA